MVNAYINSIINVNIYILSSSKLSKQLEFVIFIL